MKINVTKETMMFRTPTRRPLSLVMSIALLALVGRAAPPTRYLQVNLVSDLPGIAQLQDTNLVNAWGISFSSGSPFWISDNGTGKSTLYAVTNGVVTRNPLVVNIPGDGNPTGQFFNGTPAFHTNLFIFVSEDGTISGWRPALGVNAEILAQPTNTVYKGVTLATN